MRGGDGSLVPDIEREIRRRDRASGRGSSECVFDIPPAQGLLGLSRGACRSPEDDRGAPPIQAVVVNGQLLSRGEWPDPLEVVQILEKAISAAVLQPT